MADIFHLHRRNRDEKVQFGLSRHLDAVPGLFDIAVGNIDTGRNPALYHGGNCAVGELLRLACADRSQLNGIGFQPVQAPGNLQFFLKGKRSSADDCPFPQGDIDQFHSPHSMLLSLCHGFLRVTLSVIVIHCEKVTGRVFPHDCRSVSLSADKNKTPRRFMTNLRDVRNRILGAVPPGLPPARPLSCTPTSTWPFDVGRTGLPTHPV